MIVMKKLILSLTLALATMVAFGQALTKEELKAQKKQIKQLMQTAKDADKATLDTPEAALNNVKACIENPLVNNDAYVWYVSAKARKAIVDKDNAARVAGTEIDMNGLYQNCVTLINELQVCDSLDNLPNAKGNVAPKYTEFIKTALYENRNQMYNGGSFYYNKGDFAEAYNQFAKFIDLSEYPLVKDLFSPAEAKFNVAAAYNAVLCGMQLKDYNKVLKYADYAAADEKRAKNICRYKATAYQELGETDKWIEVLKEGVGKFPEDPFFYQALIQHYDKVGDRSALTTLVDELIATNPTNSMFPYLKGYIAVQANDYDTATEWYKKTLEIEPTHLDALTNLGRISISKAQEYSNKQSSTKFDRAKMKKDKEVLNGFFSEALPYFEKVRELAPDRKDLWLNGLTNCYYNLNMSAKLKEIEALAQ